MVKEYRFDCEDYCSSYYDLDAPLTLDKLWPYIKTEGWNGKKGNYRLLPQPNGDLRLETNLDCGEPCEWRLAQYLAKKQGEGEK